MVEFTDPDGKSHLVLDLGEIRLLHGGKALSRNVLSCRELTGMVLTAMRTTLNISQLEAAGRCGMNPAQYAACERGKMSDQERQQIAMGLKLGNDWSEYLRLVHDRGEKAGSLVKVLREAVMMDIAPAAHRCRMSLDEYMHIEQYGVENIGQLGNVIQGLGLNTDQATYLVQAWIQPRRQSPEAAEAMRLIPGAQAVNTPAESVKSYATQEHDKIAKALSYIRGPRSHQQAAGLCGVPLEVYQRWERQGEIAVASLGGIIRGMNANSVQTSALLTLSRRIHVNDTSALETLDALQAQDDISRRRVSYLEKRQDRQVEKVQARQKIHAIMKECRGDDLQQEVAGRMGVDASTYSTWEALGAITPYQVPNVIEALKMPEDRAAELVALCRLVNQDHPRRLAALESALASAAAVPVEAAPVEAGQDAAAPRRLEPAMPEDQAAKERAHERIREIMRECRGKYSQEEIAEMVNVSQSTYSKWEVRGEVPGEYVQPLIKALAMPPGRAVEFIAQCRVLCEDDPKKLAALESGLAAAANKEAVPEQSGAPKTAEKSAGAPHPSYNRVKIRAAIRTTLRRIRGEKDFSDAAGLCSVPPIVYQVWEETGDIAAADVGKILEGMKPSAEDAEAFLRLAHRLHTGDEVAKPIFRLLGEQYQVSFNGPLPSRLLTEQTRPITPKRREPVQPRRQEAPLSAPAARLPSLKQARRDIALMVQKALAQDLRDLTPQRVAEICGLPRGQDNAAEVARWKLGHVDPGQVDGIANGLRMDPQQAADFRTACATVQDLAERYREKVRINASQVKQGAVHRVERGLVKLDALQQLLNSESRSRES